MVIPLSTKLSRSFTLRDFSKTESIPAQALESLFSLAELAERCKRVFENITITSGYRTPEENVKVGGAPNSLHTKGRAFDFIVQGITIDKVVEVAQEFFPLGEFIIYIKNKKIQHLHLALPSIVEGRLKVIYETNDILIKTNNSFIKLQDYLKTHKK